VHANLGWVWEGGGSKKRSGDLVIGTSGDRRAKNAAGIRQDADPHEQGWESRTDTLQTYLIPKLLLDNAWPDLRV
jgi:hypothetical protein